MGQNPAGPPCRTARSAATSPPSRGALLTRAHTSAPPASTSSSSPPRRALAALTPPRCRRRHLAASLEAKDDELARAFNPRDKRFGARRQAELLTMSSTSAAQPLLLSPSAECATQLTHMHAHANNSIASSQPPAPALSLFLQVSKSKQQSSLAQPQLMHEPATLLSSLFYPVHEATNELARQSRCDRTPTMPSCCILLHKPGHRACHGQRPNLCAVLT